MKRITLALPSPYVGLRPFTAREALLFFGRDAHVRDLLAKLEQQQRFVAVLGASGTGKSSLVRAGLIPALHRGALRRQKANEHAPAGPTYGWNVCIFKPGDAPLGQLAHALTEDARWADSADRAKAVSSLDTLLFSSPLALTTLYRQKALLFGGEALLLVVDQFEEIFRYRQRNPDEAEALVKLLLRSASEDVPIYVALTMRSDFLGNAVAFHGLPEAINGGIYLTPRLGPEQIKSVITSPLSLVGGTIDPVLANRLVNTLSGEDELPVLEHALLRMWDRARSQGRSSIEAIDFAAVCASREPLGEPMLAFAIDNHASEIYERLTPPQRAIAREFFLSLVERRDGRDVRRPRSLQHLRSRVGNHAHESLMAVIDAFRAQDAGFVLPAAGERIAPDDLLDISHESLIRRWSRLQTWLAEEDLDVAELKEWQQRALRRREGGGTLDESDCNRALRWRARVKDRNDAEVWAAEYSGPGSYELIDAYIQSSIQWTDQVKAEQEALKREADEARVNSFEIEARLQREAAERALADQLQAENAKGQALAMAALTRRRSLYAIFAALAALAFGIMAGRSSLRASRALGQANTLATTAQAGELAAVAESLSKDLPDQSLLLALEAHRMTPVPMADFLLRAAEAAYSYRSVLRGHKGSVRTAQFSGDGETVVTASDDGTARLWDAASGKEPRVLRGHTSPVRAAQFSGDGKTVVTASDDGTARLWDVASGKELRALRGHEDDVVSAQFSGDSKTVVTASADGSARLWDVDSGKELWVLRGHESPVRAVQFSGDGKTVVTASDDRTARLWDVASGKELRALRGHERSVVSAQFSGDGKTVVTASADGSARLWDVASGKELQPLRGHEGPVRAAQFSGDGKTVVTASDDGTARLWEVASGKELRALRGHEDSVVSAQFSSNRTTVVTASVDGTARLWDAASGKELRPLRGHERSVVGAQFSGDGTTVVTAGADWTARLWDVASGKELWVLREHEGWVKAAQFSGDGKTVVTASADRTARLWDVASGKELWVLRGHERPVVGAQFSGDGKTVVTASTDGTARLWDVASRKELWVLRGHERSVVSAQFSGDGKTVVTASADESAQLWDVASGKQLWVLRGHESPVRAAQFSGDGKTVVTASDDRTARLWDVASGKELRALRGHERSVVSAQFSGDGKTVVTASVDGTARLWDAASGEELQPLRGHERPVLGAQFSVDGKTVVTASADGTARLWDVASGKQLRVLRGHESPVGAAQFSGDGKTIVTASDDGTARLWDVASGKVLRALRGHEDSVVSAQFSGDGKTVVTASADWTARLWECAECRPVEELALKVAKKVGRELIADERRQFGLQTR